MYKYKMCIADYTQTHNVLTKKLIAQNALTRLWTVANMVDRTLAMGKQGHQLLPEDCERQGRAGPPVTGDYV
jgi:hypothetical protein